MPPPLQGLMNCQQLLSEPAEIKLFKFDSYRRSTVDHAILCFPTLLFGPDFFVESVYFVPEFIQVIYDFDL